MLRIAIVSQPWSRVDPGEPLGSVPIMTCAAAERLSRSHSVSVFSNYHPRGRESLVWRNVRFQFLNDRRDARVHRWVAPLYKMRGRKRPFSASRRFYRNYYRAIAERLATEKPDVVHIHTFPQAAQLIRRLIPSVPIVVHLHTEWLNRCESTTMRRQLEFVDAVINVSDYLRETHVKALPEIAERCYAVYTGVDTRLFHPRPDYARETDCPVVLYVGRISPEKGLHHLIHAFAGLNERFPDSRLRMIGPRWMADYEAIAAIAQGSLRGELARFYDTNPVQSMLSKLRNRAPRRLGFLRDRTYGSYLERQIPPRLKSSVEFVPHKNHSELAEEYRKADVVVQPSLYETFGMPLVEAMASGIPTIGTSVGGIPEVSAHGACGLLVPSGDAAALENAMAKLLAERATRKSLGQAGRARVEQVYSWDRITECLERAYQSALDRRRKAPNRL